MFVVSLRLLQAITVILCFLVCHWRHFGSNLALSGALWTLLGSLLAVFFGTTWALLGLSWLLPGLSRASFGVSLSLLGHARDLSWKMIALGSPFLNTFEQLVGP